MNATAHCWVLTDGKVGMLAQAEGLAEAVGIPIERKTLHLGRPWSWLPPTLWPPGFLGLRWGDDQLRPPWPDLVISCGTHAVGPALEVKRRSGGRTVAVHIQNPSVRPSRFDLVAVPRHDRLSGPNVEPTLGAVNGITPAKLTAAAERFRTTLDHLPRPLVAVLIGGSNAAYTLDAQETAAIAEGLEKLAKTTGAGLAVTTSRRTGHGNEVILREGLRGVPAVIWDGRGDNPYLGYLGLADAIVATCDSVNMVTEACMTGKPVHVVYLPGTNAAKFEQFHADFQDAGMTRRFDGRLDSWRYDPPDDTRRIAGRIRAMLGLEPQDGAAHNRTAA